MTWRLKLILYMAMLWAPYCAHGAEPYLIDFTADWCVPCQSMKPVLEKLRARGIKVQVEDCTDGLTPTGAKYGVGGLPTFVAVKDGKEIGRIVGSCTERELLRILGKAPPRTTSTGIKGQKIGSPILLVFQSREIRWSNNCEDTVAALEAVAKEGLNYRYVTVEDEPELSKRFGVVWDNPMDMVAVNVDGEEAHRLGGYPQHENELNWAYASACPPEWRCERGFCAGSGCPIREVPK